MRVMGHRILVVDDERIVCRAVKKVLENDGYEVDTALTAEDGVRLAKEKAFQMVLVDLVLPGMNGLQACKILKKSAPSMKVVLMSGYVSKLNETKEEFESIGGCRMFIEKPFGGEEIVSMAKDFFERGQSC